MYQPGVPPHKPPMIVWDVVISVAALVMTVVLGGFAVLAGIFSLAFLDYCPPETCSAGGALTAVATAIVVAGIIGVLGLIWAIVRMGRRKISWPIAVGTFTLCLFALGGGIVGYAAAVG